MAASGLPVAVLRFTEDRRLTPGDHVFLVL